MHNELIEEILRKITKRVAQLDRNRLESNNLSRKLLEEFTIQFPQLKYAEASVVLGKEKVTKSDRPKGCVPGQIIDFSLFTVPVEGSYELFVRILKNYSWNEDFYHEQGKVFYKERSKQGIIGNGQVIKKIRLKAGDKFKSIEQILLHMEPQVQQFNTTRLMKEIRKAVKAELSRRAAQRKATNKLNPWI